MKKVIAWVMLLAFAPHLFSMEAINLDKVSHKSGIFLVALNGDEIEMPPQFIAYSKTLRNCLSESASHDGYAPLFVNVDNKDGLSLFMGCISQMGQENPVDQTISNALLAKLQSLQLIQLFEFFMVCDVLDVNFVEKVFDLLIDTLQRAIESEPIVALRAITHIEGRLSTEIKEKIKQELILRHRNLLSCFISAGQSIETPLNDVRFSNTGRYMLDFGGKVNIFDLTTQERKGIEIGEMENIHSIEVRFSCHDTYAFIIIDYCGEDSFKWVLYEIATGETCVLSNVPAISPYDIDDDKVSFSSDEKCILIDRNSGFSVERYSYNIETEETEKISSIESYDVKIEETKEKRYLQIRFPNKVEKVLNTSATFEVINSKKVLLAQDGALYTLKDDGDIFSPVRLNILSPEEKVIEVKRLKGTMFLVVTQLRGEHLYIIDMADEENAAIKVRVDDVIEYKADDKWQVLFVQNDQGACLIDYSRAGLPVVQLPERYFSGRGNRVRGAYFSGLDSHDTNKMLIEMRVVD